MFNICLNMAMLHCNLPAAITVRENGEKYEIIVEVF